MANVPTPGEAVRGSKTGVPIMALFDLLGRRWAMGVMWTLCQHGPCTFRDLQSKCETISPAVLNTRLKELRQVALVDLDPGGYQATATGQELYALLRPLGAWSKKWAKRVAKAPR
jgi:DNA-binding HxlR family transcriptional regulator